MREVCYYLVLVLQFGDLLSLGALQLLDLIVALSLVCAQFAFGIWYSYLVFVNCDVNRLYRVFKMR